VDEACAFLDGKSREWLEERSGPRWQNPPRGGRNLKRPPSCATSCSRSKRRSNAPASSPATDPTSSPRGGPRSLQEALGLAAPPAHMECFDISHISGTFVVASMVHFTDGRPDKDHYRRFAIKSFIGNDDFRAMEEVVGRRYRRLIAEEKMFPTSW
jgi:excinuclease ABC subunit C